MYEFFDAAQTVFIWELAFVFGTAAAVAVMALSVFICGVAFRVFEWLLDH